MNENKIRCYFRPEQVAASVVSVPSLRKIAPVVEGAVAAGLVELVGYEGPVSREDLAEVHSAGYVDGVLGGRLRDGFGLLRSDVPEAARHACASLLAAAFGALEHGIAFSPTQGFHHAGYADGYGFCTFNGLALAASRLVAAGHRVAIVDGDGHYGDGTASCLQHLPAEAQRSILHLPAGDGSEFARAVRAHSGIDGVELAVRRVVRLVEAFGADIVLYQAGADAHADDPLGAGFLDNAQFVWRDRLLFGGLRGINCAVCFNLAGGYQDDDSVVQLHLRTIQEAAAYA